MNKAKHKKGRIISTSAKSKFSIKSEKDKIVVNITYLMELFKSSAFLLEERKQMTDHIAHIIRIRVDTLAMVLLYVIGVEKEHIRKITDSMKKDKDWWESEVKGFVEKEFGTKAINIITPDDFEKELIGIEKRKATQRRLFDGGGKNILER